MVTGNEHVFDNIYETRDYILNLEKQALAEDKTRHSAPICFSGTDDIMSFHKNHVSLIPRDSVDYPFTAYFNDASDEKFILNRLFSGRYSLKPNLREHAFLYRGETEFHAPCVPNLFRNPKKAYYLDDIIYGDEMFRLILSHPLVQLLDIGVSLKGRKFCFEMNLYGLIQHYYNKSSLLDMTSDINVAMFFATHKYDWKTDSYTPIEDDCHEPGILYYYRLDIRRDFQPQPNGEQLSTIGLQVFPRSGRQKGFLYDMCRTNNFNSLPQLQAFRFKHDATIARDINCVMNGGDKLFPLDILMQHWKNSSRNPNIVSLDAVKINKTRNPEETVDSLIIKLKKDYNIEVVDNKPVLNQQELHEYFESMKDGSLWKEFCNQIYIPGDDGSMMQELLDVPNKPEYEWAFKEGIEHTVDFKKSFLLKNFKCVYE